MKKMRQFAQKPLISVTSGGTRYQQSEADKDWKDILVGRLFTGHLEHPRSPFLMPVVRGSFPTSFCTGRTTALCSLKGARPCDRGTVQSKRAHRSENRMQGSLKTAHSWETSPSLA